MTAPRKVQRAADRAPIVPATRAARRLALAVALAFASATSACFDGQSVPERYALAPSTVTELASATEVRQRIDDDLTRAFGSPRDPRYAIGATWKDLGIDPNRPDLPAGAEGSGEIPAAEMDALAVENRRTFARQLARIESGDLDVETTRAAPTLTRALRAVRDELAAGHIARDAAIARGRELVLGFYPRLADSAELYRVECLHCHGFEGGGDGPTGRFLDPWPRDFRLGIFKWTALADQSRPRRADLLRTLEQGVNGTAMPSFARLSLVEREGLVDYVRFLAIRGEVERSMVATWKLDGELGENELEDDLALVWSRWKLAPTKVVAAEGAVPHATPELVARGAALFHDATSGNCASCHGDAGRGDGPAAWKVGLDGVRVPAYLDAWDRPILPRNPAYGIFHGGSRPIDLYRRIRAGIAGTPMPAMGDAKKPDGTPLLAEEDVWALVHYVRSLSNPELATRSED